MFHNGVVVAATVAAIVIIFIFFRMMGNGTTDAGRRYPPSASALSLLVAVLREGIRVLPDHFMRSAQKLGPVICYNFGGRRVVILNGKEAISEAFLRQSETFADKPQFWTETNILNKDLRVQSQKDIFIGIEEGIECSKSFECESTFVRRFIEMQGPDYHRQDLLYIVRDLCLASADSASTVLHWAMVELANHPEIQKRFQREIDDVVPKERFPSLDDKPRLPYTEAVILEVMRRHTIAPLYMPHATLTDTEVLGCYIQRGCLVLANAYGVHMDPKSWKDPENFRPERFLDEKQKIAGSDKVIPFGLGKRSCLGESLGRQKTFLYLTSLIQRFDIRPPEGQDSIRVKEVIAFAVFPSEFEVRLIPRIGDHCIKKSEH